MNTMFSQGAQRGEAVRELVEFNCYARWTSIRSMIMTVVALLVLVLAAIVMGMSGSSFTDGFMLNWILVPIGFLMFQTYKIVMAFNYRRNSVHLKQMDFGEISK